MQAMIAIRAFDKAAGHNTNIQKSAVFANKQETRDPMRHATLDGQQMPVAISEDMVGHQTVA